MVRRAIFSATGVATLHGVDFDFLLFAWPVFRLLAAEAYFGTRLWPGQAEILRWRASMFVFVREHLHFLDFLCERQLWCQASDLDTPCTGLTSQTLAIGSGATSISVHQLASLPRRCNAWSIVVVLIAATPFGSVSSLIATCVVLP